MKIRPHHLLCIGNYIGKGYSRDFEKNMEQIIGRLKSGEEFVLCGSADDICSACPFNNGGTCKTAEKVERYDSYVLNALGLGYGKKYGYAPLAKAISAADVFKDACGDCEWNQLCRDVMENKNKNTRKN